MKRPGIVRPSNVVGWLKKRQGAGDKSPRCVPISSIMRSEPHKLTFSWQVPAWARVQEMRQPELRRLGQARRAAVLDRGGDWQGRHRSDQCSRWLRTVG